jgi:cobalt/nickel transport system permease protein
MLVMIAGQIHTSQTSRLGYSTFRNQFRSMGQLISSLFIISYKKVNGLFMALESRCYNGKMNVLEKKYKFSPVNIIMIMAIELSLVILTVFTGKLS